MKILKVYVQKPWKVSDSPYYKTLREFPSSGIKYVNLPKSNLLQSKAKKDFYHKLKGYIKSLIRVIYSSMPNLHFTKNAKNYDLIHCAHCISANNHPWICNMEYAKQFWVAPNYLKQQSKKIVSLYLNSNNCKKIIAWTNWVRDDIVKMFPSVANKVEVVYPGVPTRSFKKKNSKKIRLLFVSRDFYFKGGLYAVEAMDQLIKKFDNVEGIIVSDVPKEVYKKYSKNKKIKFYKMMPQKKLFEEIYPSADIFIYPSFTDTFGFAITEAMSFGLPVICVRGQSRDEIISDRNTGFVVDSSLGDIVKEKDCNFLTYKKILNEIVSRGIELVNNKFLRKKMSRNCLKEISVGKFSIKKRNRKLKKIYREALE